VSHLLIYMHIRIFLGSGVCGDWVSLGRSSPQDRGWCVLKCVAKHSLRCYLAVVCPLLLLLLSTWSRGEGKWCTMLYLAKCNANLCGTSVWIQECSEMHSCEDGVLHLDWLWWLAWLKCFDDKTCSLHDCVLNTHKLK
jgi:hypothetical protein